MGSDRRVKVSFRARFWSILNRIFHLDRDDFLVSDFWHHRIFRNNSTFRSYWIARFGFLVYTPEDIHCSSCGTNVNTLSFPPQDRLTLNDLWPQCPCTEAHQVSQGFHRVYRGETFQEYIIETTHYN